MIKSCILKSKDDQFLDVSLNDKTPVIIGRSPLTKIKLRRCARAQVEATANYEDCTVKIRHLGSNPSVVSGRQLRRGDEVQVPEDGVIHLLKDEIPYTVAFQRSGHDYNGNQNCSSESSNGTEVKMHKASKADSCNLNGKGAAKRKHDDHSSPHKKHKSDAATKEDQKQKEDRDKEENEDEEDEDEEHIKKQLEEMRQKLQQPSSSSSSSSSATTSTSASASPTSSSNKSPHHHSKDKPRNNLSNVAPTRNDSWQEEDNGKLCIFTSKGVIGREKIAAFDLDGTIITTKSGKVFPTNIDDWQILYPEIPKKLKKLFHEDGYKIVIFTNQKGIARGNPSPTDFRRKLQAIIQRLGVPIQVYVSTGSDFNRKPAPGMWEKLKSKGNQGVEIDTSACFYVGDAAGREEKWAPGKKKDFSCIDRMFAWNLNVEFFTPEEYFLGQKKAPYKEPIFDPRTLLNWPLATRIKPYHKVMDYDENTIASSSQEVAVCVGIQAVGKTHFVNTYLIPKGYVHVSRDVLGTSQKCVNECEAALKKGKSVVIDNTNPDPESRIKFIQCAKNANVPCRCFLFMCSMEQVFHNNAFRELTEKDKAHAGINRMVINSFKSKFKEPDISEGFSEIVKVNFVPRFSDSKLEQLYRLFLVDK